MEWKNLGSSLYSIINQLSVTGEVTKPLWAPFPYLSKERHSDAFMEEVTPEAWTGLDDFCGPPEDCGV